MPIRTIPLDEVRQHQFYRDMANLAEMFHHEIIEDDHGTWRWKENTFVRLLLEGIAFHTPPQWVGPSHNKIHVGGLDLNELAIAFHHQKFTLAEYMKFYMQIGYSLCGYCEVFGQDEAIDWKLPGATPVPDDHDVNSYVETPIDYVLRVNKGRSLSI